MEHTEYSVPFGQGFSELFGRLTCSPITKDHFMDEENIINFNLDVLIVNFNSTDCVIHCIESLIICKPHNCDLNIFVFDNASQDDPKRIIKLFPELFISFNKRNIGFGAAVNQLLRKSGSEFLLLMNPDTLATKELFHNAVEFVRSNPDIGIAGPQILNDDWGVQGSARAFPTPLTSLFGRNSPISKIFPNNSITKSNILTWKDDNQTTMEVDWVSGACMVIRREAMQAVGGFDERFFLYWEDADLCRRIWDAGWKVVYFTGAKVIHSVGKSSRTRPVFANYQFHKSCYRLYEKYTKGAFSILVPISGIALMLRFLIAVIFNELDKILNRVRIISKRHRTKEIQKKNTLNILRTISRMNIGGPSIHVKNLTDAFNNKKYKTRLVTGTVSSNEGDMSYITRFDENVRIIIPELQREISPGKDLIAISKLVREICRFKPDIIHSHTSKAGAVSRLAAIICSLFSKKRIITVHTFHGNVLDGYFGKFRSSLFLVIERILAKVTDKIVAISDSQKWELVNVYKIDRPEKIAVINLGFDLQPFKDADQHSGQLRKRLNLSNDDILIGLVGRMAPIKNHKLFLDAAKKVIERSKNRKFKFILVGDGEERPFLEKYVDTIGIKKDVIFYGWEKEIQMVYADLDILALTSNNEGTPVSVIEAMAAFVPVVTTGVGGIKDLLGRIIEKNVGNQSFQICERGLLCPKGDPDAFAFGLSNIIDEGKHTSSDRIQRACEFVVKHYSKERLVGDIENLYDELLRTHL